jgi:hypothetical protein
LAKTVNEDDNKTRRRSGFMIDSRVVKRKNNRLLTRGAIGSFQADIRAVRVFSSGGAAVVLPARTINSIG